MNNYTYKLNFNSINGTSHARIKCPIYIKNTF
ncbi:putative translational regulatory protein ArgL [Enterobacter sp. 186315]|nr:hypothetical protein [Enterobacter asburiae]